MTGRSKCSDRGGQHFTAQSAEISALGIGVLVDQSAALSLVPDGGIPKPGVSSIAVLVHVSDPLQAGELSLEGRVRHVRRLSQAQYLLGVKFTDPDPGHQVAIQALVDRALMDRKSGGRDPVDPGAADPDAIDRGLDRVDSGAGTGSVDQDPADQPRAERPREDRNAVDPEAADPASEAAAPGAAVWAFR